MLMTRAKLQSLTVYKNILKTPAVQSLLALTESRSPEDMVKHYTDLLYHIYSEDFHSFSSYLSWHLKYDETFIGTAIASDSATQTLMDAAALDIRRLASIGMVSFPSLKRMMYSSCEKMSQPRRDAAGKVIQPAVDLLNIYGPIIQNLAEPLPGTGFTEDEIFDSYRISGCGLFALGRTFRWEKGKLTQVRHPDAIRADEMIGYELQRKAVIENTRVLMRGRQASNVLLYGDSGTGKSATVKSLVNMPEFAGLRIIQIAKNSLDELNTLQQLVGEHTQKFILYIDDLSFDQEDKGFSALKTVLEGGLERRPDNVAIYVTSNRRHMVRERFSDRQGDDVHARETLEEHSSLSERFGLRLAYLSLDKQKFSQMVLELCHRQKVPLSDQEILVKANQWELRHGGRTPRVAVQLAEHLSGRAVAGL